MRFSVVLFDLDGTVIDSGASILASMRHAAKEVLRAEPPDELLMAAVGGPGPAAQMEARARRRFALRHPRREGRRHARDRGDVGRHPRPREARRGRARRDRRYRPGAVWRPLRKAVNRLRTKVVRQTDARAKLASPPKLR